MAGSTLSADTKDSLARDEIENDHCRAALRDALFLYGTDPKTNVFRTARAAVARLGWSLLEDRKAHPIRKLSGTRLKRAPYFEIDVPERMLPRKPSARCDRRMELRGAFLACGSLASPTRGYHAEFVPQTPLLAERLASILRVEGLAPKLASRGGRRIVYFKDIDAITELLASIGAAHAVLHLEDVRALKETKNRIHRLVNTEAANVDRAMSAAAAQREAIAYLADAYGLRNLSRPLREAAELRLSYPTETLVELGRRCDPPAKKSTINGRISALLRLARHLSPRA